MNKSFIFSAYGTPRPQPRPRFVKGRAVSTAGPKAKLWRVAVDRAVREAIADSRRAKPLFTGPVKLRCMFYFVPPASEKSRLGKPHTHKPDGDNIAKLVLDVLEATGVFKNDSQVVQLTALKSWGERAGVTVLIECAAEDQPVPTGSLEGAAPDWLRPS